MATTRLLTVMVVLQGLTLASLWHGSPEASRAYGESSLPEPGLDRREMLVQLKDLNEKVSATNDKLDGVLNFLQSGKLQVITTPNDDKK
jgi:hypothetical protein